MSALHIRTTQAVRILEVEPFFSIEQSAGTFGFGSATAGDMTLTHVRLVVETRDGQSAEGWGAMLLSWPWAFPGDTPDGETKDRLMRALVEVYGEYLEDRREVGHPIEHFLDMEPHLGIVAADVARQMGITEPVPTLCALVAYSAIDAAIHDAYGVLLDTNSFRTLTGVHLGWDLSRLLGEAFAGRYPSDYLRPQPIERLPAAHTVGALDPLSPDEAKDGVIPPLMQWIEQDGSYAFKVKLKGQDLEWDVHRLATVHEVAASVHVRGADIVLYGDLNEQGPSKEYIVELLDRLEGDFPSVYRALAMLEQPVNRDFSGDSPNLADVSARVPIVLDEGLTSLATIERALELGWGGVALKTCKTQSLMMLAIPKAIEAGMHISVQDLSNPGIALVQSVGMASRLPVTRPFETNVLQYFPNASLPEAELFPGIFHVNGGEVSSEGIEGPGLGYRIAENRREIVRRWTGSV
jgi:L-alanine-DL-glutamate epimerase-like enolase superfamily enzyme